MEIKTIMALPFKEKKDMINNICLLYKKIKASMKIVDDFENFKKCNEIQKVKMTRGIKSYSIFKTLLSFLSKDSYTIIKNDFLKPNSNHDWYLDFWSKTSYYKIKHTAIDQFIYLFYA